MLAKRMKRDISRGDVGIKLWLDRLNRVGIGVEIEVERATEFRSEWQVRRDDSLRNEGLEFVTPYGQRVQDVGYLLQRFFNNVTELRNNAGAGLFQFSERTSIHVHLDCRPLTLADIKNLVIVYTVFEDALFKFAGEHRKHNIFCVPLRYINISWNVQSPSFESVIHGWKKYCALNLLRLHDFGTIEFRHMEGNEDSNRILTWVYLLASLRDYSQRISTEKLVEEIKRLKYISHYEQFSQEVFGPLSKELQLDGPEIDQAVSDAKQLFNIKVQ
jgi:hypothetical protein